MQILVPLLSHCHSAFQDSHDAVPLGPYFPRRGHPIPSVTAKGIARPLRPMVQMTVPHNQLECSRVSNLKFFSAVIVFWIKCSFNRLHNFIETGKNRVFSQEFSQ